MFDLTNDKSEPCMGNSSLLARALRIGLVGVIGFCMLSCGGQKQSFSSGTEDVDSEESADGGESGSRRPVNVAGAHLVECFVVSDPELVAEDSLVCWSFDHEFQSIAIESEDGRVLTDSHALHTNASFGHVAVVGASGIDPSGPYIGVVSLRPAEPSSDEEEWMTHRFSLDDLNALEKSANRERVENLLRSLVKEGRVQTLPQAYALSCFEAQRLGTGVSRRETIEVPAHTQRCDWQGPDTLAPLVEGRFGAYSRRNFDVRLPDGHVLCGLDLSATASEFWYQDHLLLAANDLIVATSIALNLTPLEQATGFPVYRWDEFRERELATPSGGYCGGESGNACAFPDRSVIDSLHVVQNVPFWKLLPRTETLQLSVISFGDNDDDISTFFGPWESDCTYPKFSMSVFVHSAPDLERVRASF
jgi:hypothetical protein